MSHSICARCHAHVPHSSDHAACPACGAEAGLEAVHDPSGPIIMFAALVLISVLVTTVSSMLSFGAG